MPKPDFGILGWTDGQLDAMFLSATALPLDAFVNSGAHEVDFGAHEIYNDQKWRGFMPLDLPVTEVTARLSLGFAKKVWRTKDGFGAETQYFGGGFVTNHSVKDITIEQKAHNLTPGRYTLLGYTAAVFEHLFYDLVKPISEDLMLFRGYTGQFPNGIRGWTAVLLRRFPFAQMGIDDHTLLFGRGSVPSNEALLGTWSLDVLYYSNRPLRLGRITFNRAGNGALRIDCDATDHSHGLLLPRLVDNHFQTDRLAAVQSELRTVDRDYLVGRWTTDTGDPFAKFLAAGSPGLFHPEKGQDGGHEFTLYYLLTRLPG